MKIEKFYSEAQFSDYANHGKGNIGDRILIVPTGCTFEKNSIGMWVQVGRGTKMETNRRQKERKKKLPQPQLELQFYDKKVKSSA